MQRVAGIVAAITLWCAGPATAQSPQSTPAPAEKSSVPAAQPNLPAASTSTLVAVVVKIPIPRIDRAMLEAGMARMAPESQTTPGLIRKYFGILDDQERGSVYLWRTREAAEAFYNDAWQAAVKKRFGAPAELSYFDVPIAIECSELAKVTFGLTAADAANSKLVAVVVRIPIPAKLDRSRLVAGMVKSIPEFQALPGLVRKYYTISDDQKFGGIYLWVNRQAAEAHFNDEWQARMVKTYGAPAEVSYLDVPIVVDGPAAKESVSPSAMTTP